MPQKHVHPHIQIVHDTMSTPTGTTGTEPHSTSQAVLCWTIHQNQKYHQIPSPSPHPKRSIHKAVGFGFQRATAGEQQLHRSWPPECDPLGRAEHSSSLSQRCPKRGGCASTALGHMVSHIPQSSPPQPALNLSTLRKWRGSAPTVPQ